MRSCLRHRLPRCAVPRCLHRPAFAPCHVTLAALPRCAVRCLGPDACHATAMRSCLRHRPRCSQRPLPWPRCLHPCLRAHAFRSRPASSLPGHVTLPRCSVAFAISPDAVQDRFRTLLREVGSRPHAFRSRPASSLPAMSRYRDAQLPSPSAPMQSKTALELSCGKLFTFRTLLREVVHLRKSTTRCTVADGGGLPGLRVLSRASWGYDLRQRIG